jgi:two-component system, OmpR family, alkaline phosphatase synthesis response regulator PhoP
MSRAKVLCVEDDPDMIEYIKLILSRAGYEVIGADGGIEGLEAMRREKPDLILLDLMMPEVDGAEVLLRKKQDPSIRDIPVIALTALNSPFDQIMWLARTDLQDFVVKSKLPRRELIARIERVLHRSAEVPNEGTA